MSYTTIKIHDIFCIRVYIPRGFPRTQKISRKNWITGQKLGYAGMVEVPLKSSDCVYCKEIHPTKQVFICFYQWHSCVLLVGPPFLSSFQDHKPASVQQPPKALHLLSVVSQKAYGEAPVAVRDSGP